MTFRLLSRLACLAALGLVAAPAMADTDTAGKPNIILILADDMDYNHLSITGSNLGGTPNIDSIAKNGVQFTRSYVTCPVCGPSRVGILTGRYQDRVGFVSNHGPKIPENFGLPGSEVLLPEMLKPAGYTTGMIGKWHLGFKPDMVPNAQGFDYYFGHLHGAHDYNPGVEDPGPILRNTTPVKTTQYLTREFGDEAAKFITDSKTPYFLYVPFNAVHAPLQAPEETLKKFASLTDEHDRVMAAMLYELDNAVGKIVKAAREKDNLDNTIIIFTNDNGGTRGNLPKANGILRAGKASVYEGGTRVPMFIQWNGHITSGTQYNKNVSMLDLVPTLLSAAGASTTVSLEGVDLMPYVAGTNPGAPHEELFWHFVDAPNQRAVLKDDWKLVQPKDDAPWELYDLSADPAETKNLADKHGDIVQTLKTDWDKWNSQNAKPLWLDVRILNKRKENQAEDKGTSSPPQPNKKRKGRGKAQED